MVLRPRITGIVLPVIFVFLFFSASYAAAARWDFNESPALTGWEVEGAHEAYVDGDGLVIRGSGTERLISARVDMPSNSVLHYDILSPSGGVGAVAMQTSSFRVYIKPFTLPPSGRYQDLSVYAGDYVPRGERIARFAVEFAGIRDVKVKSVRIYEASFMRSIPPRWRSFWEPDSIRVSTVNFITTPRFAGISFMVMLYVLTAAAFAAIVIFSIVRGRKFAKAVALEAVAGAFFISALAYTARMDYNWMSIWKADIKTISGKDTDERARFVFNMYGDGMDGFFDFVEFAKAAIPQGGSIRTFKDPYDNISIVGGYLFLPRVSSDDGAFIWTYNDPGVYFDRPSSSLKRGDAALASPVRLVGASGGGAVYEVLKGEKR